MMFSYNLGKLRHCCSIVEKGIFFPVSLATSQAVVMEKWKMSQQIKCHGCNLEICAIVVLLTMSNRSTLSS